MDDPSVDRARIAALAIWGEAPIRVREADATMASPSWWGADSRRYLVDGSSSANRTNGQAALVKLYDAHTTAYVDWAPTVETSRLAGAHGLAPKVLAADPSAGVVAYERLDRPWRTATVDDFDDSDAAARLAGVRRAVAEIGALPVRRHVFDELGALRDLAARTGAALPPDLPWLLRQLQPAAEAIAAIGWDDVAAHGDANTSNVMVDDAGGIQLLDWDSAAMMDPLQDLGSLLAELRPLDDERARELFVAAYGSWEVRAFDRCRLYGVADAVRWGLIASYADASRPGTHEYSKFADWQFLRARFQMSQPTFTARIQSQHGG